MQPLFPELETRLRLTTCSSVHSYWRQEAALRASASGRPLPSPLGPPRSRLQPRALRASPRCPAPRACPPAAPAPRPRRAPTPEGTCTPHMHAPHARPAPWEAPGKPLGSPLARVGCPPAGQAGGWSQQRSCPQRAQWRPASGVRPGWPARRVRLVEARRNPSAAL